MSTVDNRVVEMQFDDADFTPGIKKAIDALGQLQQALKLDVPKNGMTALSANTVAVSGAFEGLQYIVAKTANSFSTLEVAALMALNNIVNRAVDAGLRIAKSLTIDQVTQGFGEYELKMNSIQTIMAGTGAPLEQVNELLDELNHYADKTIYTFSDMTANIGKFTNAGVELKTAVDAIQGVSNLAALSGANANEASRAMYNFAQALSAGYVKLIDWKSIENANMATVEFKNQLLETALALGTVRKEGGMYVTTTTNATGSVSEAFDATHNFNDALAHQWLTTEVLTTTLSKYVDETTEIGKRATKAATEVRTWSILVDAVKESIGSGWAMSFELIFGDYEQATKFWTSLSDAITSITQPIGDFRNEVIKTWSTTTRWGVTGREQLLNGFILRLKAGLMAVEPVIRAFKRAFDLTGLGKSLEEFTSTFYKTAIVNYRKYTNEWIYGNGKQSLEGYIQYNYEKVYETFLAFLNNFQRVGSGVVSALQRIGNAFYYVFHNIDYLSILSGINSWLVKLSMALTLSDENLQDIGVSFIYIFGAIRDYVMGLINIVGFFVQLIAPIIDAFREIVFPDFKSVSKDIASVSSNFLEFTKSLQVSDELAARIKSVSKAVFGFISGAIKFVTNLFSRAYAIVSKGLSSLLDWFDELNANTGILDKLGKAFSVLKNAAKSIWKTIKDLVSKINFRDLLGKAAQAIANLISKIDFDGIISKIETISAYISGIIETISELGPIQAFKNVIDDIANAFEKLKGHGGILGALANGLQFLIDVGSKAVSFIQSAFSSFKEFLGASGISEAFSKFIESLSSGDFTEIANNFSTLATTISTTIREQVIPQAKQAFEELTPKIVSYIQDEFIPKVQSAFTEFFSWDALGERIKGLGASINEGISRSGILNTFTNLTNVFGGFLDNLLPHSGLLFGVRFSDVAMAFGQFFSGFGTRISTGATTIRTNLHNAFGEIASVIDELTTPFLAALENADGAAKSIVTTWAVIEGIGFIDSLRNFFKSLGDFTFSLKGFLDTFKGIGTAIQDTIRSFSEIPKGIRHMFEDIGKMFKRIGTAFVGFAILEVAGSIWILAQAMKTIAEIPEDDLWRAVKVVGGITAVMALLFFLIAKFGAPQNEVTIIGDTLTNFKDAITGFIGGLKGLNALGVGIAIAAIAGSVWLIVTTIDKLADILLDDESKLPALIRAAKYITELFVLLALIAILIVQASGGGQSAAGAGLAILAMAKSLDIIIDAILRLADIPVEKAETGMDRVRRLLLTIGGIASALLLASGISEAGLGGSIGIAIVIGVIALTLNTIVDAIEKMANIAPADRVDAALDQLERIIATIAVCITLMVMMSGLTGTGFWQFIGIAASFAILAYSLSMIADALAAVAAIQGDVTGAALALGSFAAIFTIYMAMMMALSNGMSGVDVLLTAASFAVMALGLQIIANALNSMMSETLDVGQMFAVAGALALLVVAIGGILAAMTVFSKAGGWDTLFAAASIAVVAIALQILVGVLIAFNDVDWESLGKVAVVLLGILAASALVGLCTPLAAGLIILAGALLVMGAAALLFGTGALLFGEGVKAVVEGLKNMSEIKAEAFESLGEALHDFSAEFNVLDAGNIGAMAAALGPFSDAIVALADGCKKLSESKLNTIALGMGSFMDTFADFNGLTPEAREFSDFVSNLATYIDSLATAIGDFLVPAARSNDVIKKLNDTIPVFSTVISDMSSNAEAFKTALSEIGSSLHDFMETTVGVSDAFSNIGTAASEMVSTLANGIIAQKSQITTASSELVSELASGMEASGGIADTALSNLVSGFVARILTYKDEMFDAGRELSDNLRIGIKSLSGQIGDDLFAIIQYAAIRAGAATTAFAEIGRNMLRGLLSGLSDQELVNDIYNAAYNASARAAEGSRNGAQVKSPSRVFMRIGQYMSEGLAIGISDGSSMAEEAAFNMAHAVSMVAQDSIDEINASKYDIYLNPVIDDAGLNSLTSGLMLNGMNFGMLGNTIAALNQNGTNGDLLAELQMVHRDLVEVASRPTTSIQMGDINTYDDAAMMDATKSYLTTLATLRGGM